ncbi:hypothetical protein BOTBODRAFT_543546 [Botryobasidium botryosum FD-172 SS1]|uniref:Acyl-CoA desaturase n=1 Tax=Botryobasidium botryosum (strain FD-172 SS1) TaxID=930990 RepID=A0A067MQA9_BOTB1|nr:hypothetical protein BOTBODRAFT_543546 [Botryobasidium botryosum FD-172 SS1]
MAPTYKPTTHHHTRPLKRLAGRRFQIFRFGRSNHNTMATQEKDKRTDEFVSPWNNFLASVHWEHFVFIASTPLITLYGAFTTALCWQTALFSVFYYFFTGLGITAGYHRLWSHRSYNASKPLEYLLALAGAGAIQRSIKWWSYSHRAHHRYTDTPRDPYNAHRGLFWAHVGWLIFKPTCQPGTVDVSDLKNNPVVMWQHRWFYTLAVIMGIFVPTLVAGLGWGDWRGGFYYAAISRLVFVHHSTFCVNSLAHWLGEAPFDDKHTPRDHFVTALVSLGEGYHNFHHQFPMDYRNATKWYQYDPTKWLIVAFAKLGLASQLKAFPENEIQKGQLTMQLKKAREMSDRLQWPPSSSELPVVSWESFQEQAKARTLVLVAGFIHDVGPFLDEHPGGRRLLESYVGRDATAAFFGGVYGHSNAAHNLLAMMRVGVLHGGMELEADKPQLPTDTSSNGLNAESEYGSDRSVPPSQQLQILRSSEIAKLSRTIRPALIG